MPMDYEDEEMDDFPMMAKRKMMRMMKAKQMEDESDDMEKESELTVFKIEINVGGSKEKQ